ncbi:MAG TPA: hypothetical protein VML19_29395 [Verrucomicrobiae bacterium]|nr:hypothetical protein [Verrucomicrobiae bacterium]
MRRFLFLLMAVACTAFCADDPWIAVTKLTSGTEIRVVKKGSSQPVIGKFDEANDERVLLVVKNSQISIAKDQIDRLDARPSAPSRVKVEGKNTVDDPQAAKEPQAGMNGHPGGSTTTSSTSVSVGGKPDFETVYHRTLGAPKGGDTKK